MHMMGFTLNVVTLLSLSLVVGILVDDAIVEIENIMRHLRMGKKPLEAAHGSGRRDRPGGDRDHVHADRGLPADRLHERRAGQVLRPVRLDGGDRRLLLARRRAHADADDGGLPVEARRRKTHPEPKWMPALHAAGRLVFEAPREDDCSRPPSSAVGSCAPVFTGSIAGAFIPPDDLSQTQVYISLPPGSTFKQTLAVAEQAREAVQKNKHVKLVYTAVGGGASGSDPFCPAARPRRARRR